MMWSVNVSGLVEKMKKHRHNKEHGSQHNHIEKQVHVDSNPRAAKTLQPSESKPIVGVEQAAEHPKQHATYHGWDTDHVSDGQ